MPDRFSKVDNNLLRGGRPSFSDLDALKNVWGVKKIVSLDAESANAIADKCKELELEQIVLPLGDGTSPNVNLLPAEVLQWPKSKTYVHCFHGKDRTGMACAMYRILVNGWDLQDALTEAYNFGMGAGLSPKVKKSYYNAVRSLYDDMAASDDMVSVQRDTLETKQPSPAINNSYDPLWSIPSWAPFSDVENDHLNSPASQKNDLIKIANIYKYIYAEIKEKNKCKKCQKDNKCDKCKEDENDVPLIGLHDNYTGLAPMSYPGSGGGFVGNVGGFGGEVQLPYEFGF